MRNSYQNIKNKLNLQDITAITILTQRKYKN